MGNFLHSPFSSFLGSNIDLRILSQILLTCPSQETEVTSTPTRPVDNVVITTIGLQDRNNNCLMERRWKIKVN